MGYFEKRGENKWRLVVVTGYKTDGTQKRERKNISIDNPLLLKSQKKIKDFLNKELIVFEMEVQAGNYITPGRMKFSDFIIEWRNKYALDSLSPSSLDVYDNIIRSRLLPVFGHMLMEQIKAMHILTFIKDLDKPGSRKDGKEGSLDSGTVGYIYRVLKNIFTRAVDWKLLSENPMEGIVKPAPKDSREKHLEQRNNPQFFDEREAQLVVDALYKETRKWRLLILGSMFGGCRRGELLALEWPNVNTQEQTITIENNIPISKQGNAIEKGPKSIASYRNIDMPNWYMEEINKYYDEWHREKDRLGTKWAGAEREFIFHNGTGVPYYYQHPSKWWKRFCTRHNLRYIKFHGLRHSAGTLLLEDETESSFDSVLKAIQERLGHSRLSTTSDLYIHVTKKVKKKTAGKYDKFSRSDSQDTHKEELDDIGGELGEELKLIRIK